MLANSSVVGVKLRSKATVCCCNRLLPQTFYHSLVAKFDRFISALGTVSFNGVSAEGRYHLSCVAARPDAVGGQAVKKATECMIEAHELGVYTAT